MYSRHTYVQNSISRLNISCQICLYIVVLNAIVGKLLGKNIKVSIDFKVKYFRDYIRMYITYPESLEYFRVQKVMVQRHP